MSRYLDARTSQNASYRQSLNAIIPVTPVLFGQVGLIVANPGGILRVQFTATATIQFPPNLPITSIFIQVTRGAQITDPVVYSSELTIPGLGDSGSLIFPYTVTGSDYNVPAPPSNLLVYSAFISSSNAIPSRFGPESFNAAAYSDF